MTTTKDNYRLLADALLEGAVDEAGFVLSGPEDGEADQVQVLDGTKLAIPFSTVPLVFRQAKRKLQQGLELPAASLVLILINGGHHTAWNVRKRLILDAPLDPIKDLTLTRIVFRKNPKSAIGYAHRRWVWKHAEAHGLLASEAQQTKARLSEEAAFCQELAGVYPKNYYAWSHRTWLLEFARKCLCTIDSQEISEDHKDSPLRLWRSYLSEETKSTLVWCRSNVSDHSGLSFLAGLAAKWLSEQATYADNTQPSKHQEPTVPSNAATVAQDRQSQGIKMVTSIVDTVADLCCRYPNHESLWCALRRLAAFLSPYASSCDDQPHYKEVSALIKKLLDHDKLCNVHPGNQAVPVKQRLFGMLQRAVGPRDSPSNSSTSTGPA